MATIIGKKKICEIKLSDFGFESIEGIPFYKRYTEFCNVTRKYLPGLNFGQMFAEPVEGLHESIEWFLAGNQENMVDMVQLKEADPDAWRDACAKRNEAVAQLKSVGESASPNALRFIQVLANTLEAEWADSMCAVEDGQLRVKIWGVQPKPGSELSSVVRMNALDHTVFSVQFSATNGGTGFGSIMRRNGHVIGPADIPQVTPASGYTFSRWEPDAPNGKKVTSDMSFTAVCEPAPTQGGGGVQSGGGNPGANNNPGAGSAPGSSGNPSAEGNKDIYNVDFRSAGGGTLHGTLHYRKAEGDYVSAAEVPTPVPESGYRFTGWDCEPDGYRVDSDVVFIAHFDRSAEVVGASGGSSGNTGEGGYSGVGGDTEVGGGAANGGWHTSFWRSLLRWLLLGLLLLILLLLWCFLFGNCWRGNCGCNCDPVVVPNGGTTTVVDPNNNLPVSPCNVDDDPNGSNSYFAKEYDMGSYPGRFVLDYWTGDKYKDHIIVYDGRGTTGKVLWEYDDLTGSGVYSKEIDFTQQYVTIVVDPSSDQGTRWRLHVGCPNN